MSSAPHEVPIMDAAQMARTLSRMAHEIIEKNPAEQPLAVVGIHTRGAVLAQRLRDLLAQLSGRDVPLGALDISFYRDDVAVRGEAWMLPAGKQPELRGTELAFDIDGTTIVLVDDVLYTGRTIRAAIDALFDFGRPRRIQLAVLVDRGHRELPIRPDYVGKNIPTSLPERVSVRVTERDQRDEVVLVRTDPGAER
jgi:pyrimidine operon attenuation protein / uracil phosphoribosyltransferase